MQRQGKMNAQSSTSDSRFVQQAMEPIQGQAVHLTDVEDANGSAPPENDDVDSPLLPLASQGSDEDMVLTLPKEMDQGWAVAFKINVATTLVSAICFGSMAIEAMSNDHFSGAGRRRLQHGEDSQDSDDGEGRHPLTNVLLGGAVLLGVAALVSAGILHSLFSCGRGILFSSYGVYAGLWGFAALMLVRASPAFALFPAAVCALIVVLVIKRRQRINFGAANLKVAALAIKSMPWTIMSALLMSTVQFFWCLVAGIAAVGSYVALETVTAPDGTSYPAIYCLGGTSDTESSPGRSTSSQGCMCEGEKISDGDCEFSGLGLPLMFVWILSMAWGCNVIRNVVACTVTGSVASWWFTPLEDSAPVKGAFYRATHSSFGSLCKAAVVQQIMAGLYVVARRVMRFVPCVAYLLSWANAAVKYILAYTICFIGIYGLDFNKAGRRVHELFQRRGVTTLANDVAVEVGLRLLTFTAVVFYGIVSLVVFSLSFPSGGGTTHKMDTVEMWSVIGPQIFGMVTCLLLISTILEVVRSGFKAVFVCFVQDPEALAQNHHQEVHDDLNAAWLLMQAENRPTTAAVANGHSYVPAPVN